MLRRQVLFDRHMLIAEHLQNRIGSPSGDRQGKESLLYLYVVPLETIDFCWFDPPGKEHQYRCF